MFPVAITNPIWVDADGSGRFDPNNLPGTGASQVSAPRSSPPVDVRAAFDAFPATEVSP